MPRTITAYKVLSPHYVKEVRGRYTSKQAAHSAAKNMSEKNDGTHYVHGPNDGFREHSGAYHNGTLHSTGA